MDDKGERIPTDVKDKDDGTYEIKFTAHRPGTYCLKVSYCSNHSHEAYNTVRGPQIKLKL